MVSFEDLRPLPQKCRASEPRENINKPPNLLLTIPETMKFIEEKSQKNKEKEEKKIWKETVQKQALLKVRKSKKRTEQELRK